MESYKIIDAIIQNAVKEYQKAEGQLRYGQCVFNAAFELSQKIDGPLFDAVEELRGTDVDCFYKDENVELFCSALKELLDEE